MKRSAKWLINTSETVDDRTTCSIQYGQCRNSFGLCGSSTMEVQCWWCGLWVWSSNEIQITAAGLCQTSSPVGLSDVPSPQTRALQVLQISVRREELHENGSTPTALLLGREKILTHFHPLLQFGQNENNNPCYSILLATWELVLSRRKDDLRWWTLTKWPHCKLTARNTG